MSEQASVNIPKDLLEPIIREHIAAGVVAAIGDPAELIRRLVTKACKEKVNSEGLHSQYSYENTYDFVEALAAKAIRESAKNAVIAYVNEQRPAIEAAVASHLKKQTSKFAKALVDGFVESTQQRWNLECHFETIPQR